MLLNIGRITFFCFSFLIYFVKFIQSISQHPIVIVLAFDGFRFDYNFRGKTPTLEKVTREGIRTDYLQNVFPTKTMTNFFSIATGTYAETHGVLGNQVFNTKGECISYSYEMFHYNEDIIPIWTLNELTGNERYSGTMMWASSQYSFHNKRPTYYEPYNEEVPWNQRVDIMMKWLLNTEKPVNLLCAYFEQPDSASHKYGINSRQVKEQLIRIEHILEYFFAQMKIYKIYNKVNMIILSDHGMTNVDLNNIINLNNFINSDYYEKCGTSPIIQIMPKAGFEEEIYRNLTLAQDQLKTFRVYKNYEIPERWHFKNNNRNTQILLVADLPYGFDKENKANHGYDNEEVRMHAFFTAVGPLFKKNFYVESLVNIDIYALISYALRLNPSLLSVKPNGTLSNIISILDENVQEEFHSHSVQQIFNYFIPLTNAMPNQYFIQLQQV